MSKLRARIFDHDTGRRAIRRERTKISIEDKLQGHEPTATPSFHDLEVRCVTLTIGLEYRCPRTEEARRAIRRDVEDRLLHFLYAPIIDAVYAMREAVMCGDEEGILRVCDELLDEVRT